MNHRNLNGAGQNRSQGFSTLELLLVMVVSLIIAALAIPKFDQVKRTLRIQGDARELNGAVNQAKLQAAADFTEARVFIDLGFDRANTFHVDVWNKTNGCWQVVGDSNACYTPGVSPVQNLSPGVTFGFAGVGTPPPNTQTNGITQGPRCVPVHGLKVGQVSTTSCVRFNSRGMAVDSNGTPNPDDAIYITDNTQVFAVTISQTGLSQVWGNNIYGSTGNSGWYRK